MGNLSGVEITSKNQDPRYTIDLRVKWGDSVTTDELINDLDKRLDELKEAIHDRAFQGLMH